MQEKTANQLYKESNTSLPFKEWIQREKDKGKFIQNQLLKDVVNQEKTPEEQNMKASFSLGVPHWVLISGIIVVVGAIVYDRYKK